MKMENLINYEEIDALSNERYATEVLAELQQILAYWEKYTFNEKESNFYNHVDKNNVPNAASPKGIVLNSRILWTFSSFLSFMKTQKIEINPDKEAKYLKIASIAFQYLINYFKDKEFGGMFWSVKADGSPLDKTKQMYGNCFALYGLSEYYHLTQKQEVLNEAIALYQVMEKYAFDKVNLGYIDAFEQDWQPTTKLYLSSGGAKKTMNTHLHIMEAYTNFYRVWKDEGLKKQLENVINNFLNHIIDPTTHHLLLYFQEDWKSTANIDSYGHDIECAWLLLEAAEVLGEEAMVEKVKPICVQMALAAAMGLNKDGSMKYEFDRDKKHFNEDKSWWVQSEAMVGFFNAWQLTKSKHFLEKSKASWKFVQKHLIDKEKGEWFASADNRNMDKVTLWKCPYHNSRTCMEMYNRLKKGT